MLTVIPIIVAISISLGQVTCMPGGLYPSNNIDISDPNVVFAANQINAYFAKKGDNVRRTLSRIIKAEQQVVNGIKYYFELEMQAGYKTEHCQVSVWQRRNWRQLGYEPIKCKQVSVTTTPTHVNSCFGCTNAADSNSNDVKEALGFATNTWNADHSRYKNQFVVRSVDRATKQVVAGMSFRLQGVTMAETSCAKCPSPIDFMGCSPARNAYTVKCDFSVLHQPWLRPMYKLTHVFCQ